MLLTRYYAAVFGGLFTEHEGLKLQHNAQFWSIVYKWSNSDQQQDGEGFWQEFIAKVFPHHSIDVKELCTRAWMIMRDHMTLLDYLTKLNEKVKGPNKELKEKSFIGTAIRYAYVDFVQSSFDRQVSTARALSSKLKSFTHMSEFRYSTDWAEMLSFLPPLPAPAPQQPPKFPKDGFLTCGFDSKVANDLEAMQAEFHRRCDLGGPHTELLDTSRGYASQGYLQLSLQALYEAFISDRLGIVRNMKSDEAVNTEGGELSAVDEVARAKAQAEQQQQSHEWNRELVGWLATMMSYYGRTDARASAYVRGLDVFNGIAPALDYTFADLASFLERSAKSQFEKVASRMYAVQAFLEGTDVHGKEPGDGDLQMLESTLFDPASINTLDHAVQFARHVMMISWRLGMNRISSSYSQLVLDLCSTKMNTEHLAVTCDVLLRRGLYEEQPLAALAELAQLREAGKWNEGAHVVYLLLFGHALVRAHAPRAGKEVLEQLRSYVLPQTVAGGLKYVEVEALMYAMEFEEAYVTARRYAREYMLAKNTSAELFFLTKSVRALVCARSPHCASEAHVLLCSTLKRALACNMAGLVFELAVLRAQLFFDNHDFESAASVCDVAKPMLNVSATPVVALEFALLLRALKNEGQQPLELGDTDVRKAALSLFTEFRQELAAAYDTSGFLAMDSDVPNTLSLRQDSSNPLAKAIKSWFSTPTASANVSPSQIFEDCLSAYMDTASFAAQQSSFTDDLEPVAPQMMSLESVLHLPKVPLTSTPIARNDLVVGTLLGDAMAGSPQRRNSSAKRFRENGSPQRSQDTKRFHLSE